VLIISVIVKSNCHILQFLHQVFNVSVLLLDDTQGSVATELRCGGIFSDSIIKNFLLILIVK